MRLSEAGKLRRLNHTICESHKLRSTHKREESAAQSDKSDSNWCAPGRRLCATGIQCFQCTTLVSWRLSAWYTKLVYWAYNLYDTNCKLIIRIRTINGKLNVRMPLWHQPVLSSSFVNFSNYASSKWTKPCKRILRPVRHPAGPDRTLGLRSGERKCRNRLTSQIN